MLLAKEAILVLFNVIWNQKDIPNMVQTNVCNIFWYLLIVLINVFSVRSYARSFECKNTLQKKKGRTCLKIFKENWSFLFNYDVVYEKLDLFVVSKGRLHVFPNKISYIKASLWKTTKYWYLCILWGRLACSKLQRCKTVPRGHSTTTWDKFYSFWSTHSPEVDS